VEIFLILVSSAPGCGRGIDVSWDSWLLNEAREKEYIDSARCKPMGLKYDCELDDEAIV
jgi:hypothetical protein